MIAVASVSKRQTDMSYKGELQTLTNLSMRHQVCPGETCHKIVLQSMLSFSMLSFSMLSFSMLSFMTTSANGKMNICFMEVKIH